MKSPIHDVVERTPQSGDAVRVWLEDGTETTAIFSAVWWDRARGRCIQPVRWQGLEESWREGAAGDKQPELGLNP
ncbi:hypothetical protein [Roseimicrobium sp. ORNL1]|uniref:hypothetical protein n=1 Tax=Roseimicrobium sp. ORNL1 TaxID=2711231 RepID=UPI0013E1B904|nr:hypothetical protein [Roseimicrobium sp. ORNL1]QIF00073.1 hypothetical protein G5S37_00570 [Roseimicrobium sp. ORNL1]